MNVIRKIWWFFVVMMAISCAAKDAQPSGPYNQPAYSNDGYSGNAPTAAPAQQNTGGWGKKNKAAASEAPMAMDKSEAAPTQRPGLGTSFGESRSSNVREEAFVRAASGPFSVVSMFYNDAQGVAAQVKYQGGADPYPMYAYTPAGGISVSLQDDRGNILSGTQAGGKTFIVGQDGGRYSLVIQNLTGGRYEVVASIDGLDVIDGRAADMSKRGYLLAPYSTLVVDGFRTSGSTVAAFRFGAVSDSYAGLTSGDRNVGVIGVAFFAEQGSSWSTDELRKRDNANPFPGDPRYSQPPGIAY